MTLGIVSHDSGGAHLLASYVARNCLECSLVLQGPARKIFERRIGPVKSCSLQEALANCDEFLCGTSWQSDIEWQAIGAAKAAGKPVYAFLDHWINYRQRFVRDGIEQLPDEIWVGDESALQLAREVFPEISVKLVANAYFDDIRDEIASIQQTQNVCRAEGKLRVLFVSEPISEHGLKEYGDPRHWGYTEFDALRYFFANLSAFGSQIESVVIRPHPSEDASKYETITSEFGEITSVGGDRSLVHEIIDSDLIVGCESMALVVGLLAGRRVVSVIPPGGQPCCLPQPAIESLNEILSRE